MSESFSKAMSVHKLLSDWGKRHLIPDCTRYRDARAAALKQRDELQSFLASLDGKNLLDRGHRADMARALVPVLSDLATPLGDLVESVEKDRPDETTRLDVAKGMGVARQYVPQVWRRLKQDVRDLRGEVNKDRLDAFLDNVSLDNLDQQDVFKLHMDRNACEYLFVRDVKAAWAGRGRLRDRAPPPLEATDPALTWTLNEGEVQRRLQDLGDRVKRLELAYREVFEPRDIQRQLLDSKRLRDETETMTIMLDQYTVDHAYETMTQELPQELQLRMAVRQELAVILLDLTKDIESLSREEFVALLRERGKTVDAEHKHDSGGGGDKENIEEHLGAMLRVKAVAYLALAIEMWKEAYDKALQDVRGQWASVDEGIDAADALWRELASNVLAEAERGRVARQRAFPHERDDHQFYELYKRAHRRRYDHWLELSTGVATKELLRLLEAAVKPPSAVATLTGGYSWRNQVRQVKAEAVVEPVHPGAVKWFEAEANAAHAASAELGPVEQQWRGHFAKLAAALRRLADVMATKHREWQQVGRVQKARELVDRHRPLAAYPQEDKLRWEVWRELSKHWETPDAGTGFWRAEDLDTFHRALQTKTTLLPWSDLDKCVLMRTWALLAR